MSLILFIFGFCAGCIVWDYIGEDVKKAIMNKNR